MKGIERGHGYKAVEAPFLVAYFKQVIYISLSLLKLDKALEAKKINYLTKRPNDYIIVNTFVAKDQGE